MNAGDFQGMGDVDETVKLALKLHRGNGDDFSKESRLNVEHEDLKRKRLLLRVQKLLQINSRRSLEPTRVNADLDNLHTCRRDIFT